MPKCPKCKVELTDEEVVSIIQSSRGGKTSAKKAESSRENLKKALERRKISSARNGKGGSGEAGT